MACADFMKAYQVSVTILEIVKVNSSIITEEVDQLIDKIINKPNSLDLITRLMDEIFNTGSLYLIKDHLLRKQLSNWSFYIY